MTDTFLEITLPQPAVIEVVTPQVTVVEVIERGPQGIEGPPGQSSIGSSHTHSQAMPSALWSINHGLNKRRPSVTVTDTAGQVCFGQIDYVDDNNLNITFSAAFGGTAYIV